jgi:DNA-binding response OmpR family regulator
MADPSRILVVDDEPDTLGLIELTLKTAGYRVQTAANANHALKLLQQDTFDLLLLDIMMPGLSGFDLVRKLQDDAEKYPPIIFLTAKSRQEDQAIGKDLGAADYIVKPTTRGELLDSVQEALSGSS